MRDRFWARFLRTGMSVYKVKALYQGLYTNWKMNGLKNFLVKC